MEEKYRSPMEDFEIVDLGDKRLNKRLIKSTGERMQGVKSRSSAKGFYRLLGNEKCTYEKISAGCIQGTVARMCGHEKVLLVQDSTNIDLGGHKKTAGLGYSSKGGLGIQCHSCLAVSVDGVSLGLLGQSYETRAVAKMAGSNNEQMKRPIEEKESYRWIEMLRSSVELVPEGIEAITVCDREGDIFEMYAEALEIGGSFVIRSGYVRKTETNEKLLERVRKAPVLGWATLEIPRDSHQCRKARKAQMAVSSCSVSISKKKNSLTVNVVRIAEVSECEGIPVEWVLITDLPIDNAEEAMEIVQYYVQRWKIERFHYVLKSGCKVEEIQQRSLERILPVILICSMIASFILAMTYLGRVMPDISCDAILEEDEWKLLYRFAKRTKIPPDKPYSLADAIKMLGELGLGKRAPSDGDCGVKAVWLGLKVFYSAFDLLVGQV